jgi:hypothetical protein
MKYNNLWGKMDVCYVESNCFSGKNGIKYGKNRLYISLQLNVPGTWEYTGTSRKGDVMSHPEKMSHSREQRVIVR